MVGVIRKLNMISVKVEKLAVAVEMPCRGKAIRHPMIPPARATNTDSRRNDERMLHREKPKALSVPISRERDITAPYIMFMAAKQDPIPISVAMKVPRTLIPMDELV